MPVFLLTPGPVRWKLSVLLRSLTVTTAGPGSADFGFKEIVRFGPTLPLNETGVSAPRVEGAGPVPAGASAARRVRARPGRGVAPRPRRGPVLLVRFLPGAGRVGSRRLLVWVDGGGRFVPLAIEIEVACFGTLSA